MEDLDGFLELVLKLRYVDLAEGVVVEAAELLDSSVRCTHASLLVRLRPSATILVGGRSWLD